MGRAKARFFIGIGFSRAEWPLLREALLAHGRSAQVLSTGETEFEKKYTVEGELRSPLGRIVLLRTVWFVAEGRIRPKLVTAYPVRSE
ncbi:DUF6883 domain-containing protein [Magnetospira sp. QH-2]|uniref:DUF6883 domain-containing protein n=1 Tax=Magnetospira sp. (strain QH-2) TaxID=1288970 RepID=UPI0035286E98